MKITHCPIEGLLILEPAVFEDDRGYFMESFNERLFREKTGLPEIGFVQDNESLSSAGVIRGLHLQTPPFGQGKLVRVICGAVRDVAVDVRRGSPTYGKHVSVELSASNKRQFWIPEGFAHGFETLEDNTIFAYKCTNYYKPDCEKTIQWNDHSLNINWKTTEPVISLKDQKGLDFKDFESPYTYEH